MVDDRAQVKRLAKAAGAKMVDGPFLDFLDPWGNRIEVVAYADIQFSKADHVLRGMQLDGAKSEKAKKELADKGMAISATRPRSVILRCATKSRLEGCTAGNSRHATGRGPSRLAP